MRDRLPSKRHLTRAALSLAAAIASFCATYALCRACAAQPGPAILAAILAISMGRRETPVDGTRLILRPIVIAVTAVFATAVAVLIHANHAAGAVVFTCGMFLSVWLRNFGERGRMAGGLIALPLVGMLIARGNAHAPGGLFVDVGLAVFAGVAALTCVSLFDLLAERTGIVPAAKSVPPAARGERAKSDNAKALSPTSRMALQMGVAVGAAFLFGFLVFPEHWAWVVLTAFIVCSGARGRGDAAYKGALRLAGAIAGTVGAGIFAYVWLPSGPAEAIVVFAVLFAGLAFRNVNYAYWAAAMTLVLALIAPRTASPNVLFLIMRLEAIFLGALCGVGAAWFVYPIRTEAIVRRRLSDALVAFDELIEHAHVGHDERASRFATFEHRMTELEAVAPPVRWHRRLFARSGNDAHPARWIDLADGLRDHARSIGTGETEGDSAQRRGSVRRAIGLSRRAIGNHGKPDLPPDTLSVSGALEKLHETMNGKS